MATSAQHNAFSFRKHLWKQFKKNKLALVALYILLLLAAIALFAPFLANEKPLFCVYKGNTLFPALVDANPFSKKSAYEIVDPLTHEKERVRLDIADWKHMHFEKVIWCPIVYSPGKRDAYNLDYIAPNAEQLMANDSGQMQLISARFRHWLGTNARGEDVLAGLIHGTSISLSIGCLSMGVAAFIGIVLGALAGFFGDNQWKTNRGVFYLMILSCIPAWFYGFNVRSYRLSEAMASSTMLFLMELLLSLLIVATILSVAYVFGKKVLNRFGFFAVPVKVPIDTIISRGIEILNSIPIFMLIISIAVIAKPSLINIVLIIGLTSWTGIARLTRAEFIRIRNMEYIQAVEAMGFSYYRIIFRHALPNAIAPALVIIAFGIASAILSESALSFIGVGVPQEVVTWGSLLHSGYLNYKAWWLVVFPGLCILLTVTAYNLLGDGLRDVLDPRLKQ